MPKLVAGGPWEVLLGGKDVPGWVVGGCGKFVLIQSGGGDCFHRYIGGINRPPISSLSSRQTSKKAIKLPQRSPFRGSGPGLGGLGVPGEVVSWLLRHDHTGGFRAAPLAPVAGSGTGGVGAVQGPEPSQ